MEATDTVSMEVEKTDDQDNNDDEDVKSNSPADNNHDDADADADADIEAAIPPESKFHPKQRVYARDASSGLWYDAVIRRSLYGVNNNKQVQIGLVCSESEISDILEQAAKEPMWHYFVHYNQWAVNWDRWVSEDDIIESTEKSKQIALGVDDLSKDHSVYQYLVDRSNLHLLSILSQK